MDVLKPIAATFQNYIMDESKAVTRANGSYLVTGWLPVEEFADMPCYRSRLIRNATMIRSLD